MDSIIFENHEDYGQGFSASLVDGPSIDLFNAAGLEWTEQLDDAVWGERNWLTLLEECSSITIIEIEEYEGGPGMSDTYYWVAVDDPELFCRELKEIMLSC